VSNSKISALTSATTPLAGTEVLPIVQSGATKQVSVANLTAGRTQTSNGIVQGTAATGYNFTANTPASGMTSRLLNWYEEGTWSPVVVSTIGTITSYTATGTYTRTGRVVTLNCDITITNNGTGLGQIDVSNLPFPPKAAYCAAGSFGERGAIGFGGYIYVISTAQVFFVKYDGTYPGGTNYRLIGTISYPV